MGSTKDCCRLCSLLVSEDQRLHLNFDDPGNESSDSLTTKLMLFLNLPIGGSGDFSNIVCAQCANSLEFCIQFVDRCRRLHNLFLNFPSDLESIQNELVMKYPSLYQQQIPIGNFYNPSVDHTAETCLVHPNSTAFFGTSEFHVNDSGQVLETEAPIVSSVPGLLENVPQLDDNTLTLPQKGLSMDNSNIPSTAQQSVADEFQGSNKRVRKILPKGPMPHEIPTPASGLAYRKTDPQTMIPITLRAPCNYCGVVIVATSMHDLRNHICSNEKNIQCPIPECGKRVITRIAMQYHLKHHHGTPKEMEPTTAISIPVMNQPTSESSGQASDSFQYKCSYDGCSKSYKVKAYLVQHVRKHTGEKPFRCRNCRKDFFRILDLKKHKLLKICE